MRKYNYIVSAVMTAISIFIYYETSSYNTIGASAQRNSASWPRIIAVGLALCAIILFVQTLIMKEPSENEAPVISWASVGMKKAYMAIGCIVGFLILNEIFGMLLAFLVLIPVIEWIMGCKSKLMYIALPVGVVGFIYIFFYLILSVGFPKPFWG